jgi:hypothetical protein
MELLAVRTARLIANLNIEELNPSGRAIAHDFFDAFTEHYHFLKRPMTAEEMVDPENKGITFEVGKMGDVGIDKVALFNWGLVIQTSASTDACEAILQDMLNWGAGTLGLSDRPGLITRRNYVSEIVFSSDMSLPTISPKLKAVGDKVTELVGGYLGQSLPFELGGLHWFFDASQSKQVFTPFRIERFTGADTTFSEKKYYSGAPLKTADHIQVIKDLETTLTHEPTALSLDDE